MSPKRIKWGNVIIFILIISAAVAAYFYKNPDTLGILSDSGSNKQVKDLYKDKMYNTDATEAVESDGNRYQTPEPDGFIMGLDSWIGGTPALIALDRGYNNDYSLDLKFRYIPNDGDRIAALKDGKINAAEISLPAFVKLQEKYPGAGAIVGITDFSRGADGIVARSDIKTLNDMEGKRVSYVSDGMGKFILNKFLRLTGLRYADIVPAERKEMSGVVDDLKSGRADLIVSWSPDMNMVVKEINAAKQDSVKVLITTREVPNLIPTVLVVNQNTVKDTPDRVEAFLKTWFASVKYMIEKQYKAGEKLAKLMSERQDYYGEVSKEDVEESLLNIKLMSLNDNFDFFGVDGKDDLFTPIIKDTVQTWKKYGDMTGADTNTWDIVNNTFIRKLKDIKDDELLVGVLNPSLTGNFGQEAEPANDFKKQDEISIDRNTEKVAKVDIPSVYYDTGKATVKRESLEVLDEVVNILKQFPVYYLIIDANTDTIGTEETNLKLSRDRAEEIKKHIISRGIEANRLIARGWGEYRPVVAVEKTEDDRARNRRTEFTLSREVTGN